MWQFQNLKMIVVFLGAGIFVFLSRFVLLFALSFKASSLSKAGSLKRMPLPSGLEKTILFSKLCTFGKQTKKGTS
ncbi:hypothetical protein [Flavobacterium sp.]|uniref:hypothetical protein n=1 Tax=Flavobacterium sp. TaxID=239 RepID=UPI0035AFCEDE